MKRTTYQVPEIRDENDNIIQDGTFGKHSAFSNATNDGAFDYILNNLEALHDAQTAAGNAINAVDERVTTVNTNLSENIQDVSDSLGEHLNGLKFSVTGEGKLHVELAKKQKKTMKNKED